MATIELVKVRARVSIGSDIIANTPYFAGVTNQILSFNVDKARGRSASFSASLKVLANQATGALSGDTIVIEAGEDTPRKIFTGIVRGINISPCREDPSYVIMNVSGSDELSKLAGKKFTRRCRATRGTWVSIEGIARPGLRSGAFQYVPNKPWLDSIGASIDELPNVTKTQNIPNPKNTAERAPQNTGGDPEASLSVTFVTKEDGGI